MPNFAVHNKYYNVGSWLLLRKNYDTLIRLHNLLLDYDELFISELNFYNTNNYSKFIIKTSRTEPIYLKSNLDEHQNELLQSKICELLNSGFLKQSKSHRWSSPVYPKFINNNLEICVDYTELNSVTYDKPFTVPSILNILNSIQESNYFTKIVVKDGFHQLELESGSCHKTAFSTDFGHFEWTVMHHGLKNAQSCLQLVMNHVLEGIDQNCVKVYLGHILIYTKNLNHHFNLLNQILSKMSSNNIKLDINSCCFLEESLVYLGHSISKKGIFIEPNKLDIIIQYPKPTNKTELRSFLGLASQFKRFVHNFDLIARDLYQLANKDSYFQWNWSYQSKFYELKNSLANANPIPLQPRPYQRAFTNVFR